MFYIVNENNEVLGWSAKDDYDSGAAPFLFQPSWPDYTPWTKEEATEWAESWLKFESGESDIVPASGPNQEPKTKVDPSLFILPNGDMLSEDDFKLLLSSGWQPGEDYPDNITIVS